MTAHKSFKRLVRARMAKTGESYTAARAQLLANTRAPDFKCLTCSDAIIRERTGHGWEDWFALLDSWGAEALTHTEIARRAAEVPGTSGWYAQSVAVSFERASGRREVGQRTGSSGFTASASRTIGVGPELLFAAFADPSRRAGWLGDIELAERTVNKPKSARYDVGDGRTRLFVVVDPKGEHKATLIVEESRLADQAERTARTAYWRSALLRLKGQIESGT